MDDMLYTPGQGLLYRLDPRSKLFFALGCAAYLTLESKTGALLLALLALHVLSMLARATRARLLPLWRTLAPLLIIVVLFGSFQWRALDPLLAVGPVATTLPGVWRAVGLGARLAGLSLALSLMLWTTEPGDAIAGLTRLGVPFAWSFPGVMVLQYVVTFRRQFTLSLEAQQSRGLVLARGHPIKMARAYIPVLIPLIIAALRSVDSLTLALQSRGFEPGRPRSSRRTVQLVARDGIFMLLTCCVLIGLSLV
jgi:energy-coupling factor transport system permease protein